MLRVSLLLSLVVVLGVMATVTLADDDELDLPQCPVASSSSTSSTEGEDDDDDEEIAPCIPPPDDQPPTEDDGPDRQPLALEDEGKEKSALAGTIQGRHLGGGAKWSTDPSGIYDCTFSCKSYL